MPNVFRSGTTRNSASAVTTTSSQIVGKQDKRMSLSMFNESTGTIYLALDETAVPREGIILIPNNSPFTINSDNLYTGTVSAVMMSGSGTVTYVEMLTE